jgi:hypothetical protein
VVLYIVAMDNIYQKKINLPQVLLKYALNTASNVGEFLKLINEMAEWDTDKMEAFYHKHPGLRPD